MDEITNWGKYPKIRGELKTCQTQEEVIGQIKQAAVLTPRGNGRCYGHSALGTKMISVLPMNRILYFDEQQGMITVEAGLLIDQLLHFIIPRGFILPVLPGSKFISLGGAVAANVHGKNHTWAGALAEWIVSLKVINASGHVVHCSPQTSPDFFAQTIGGMGLSGVIIEVSLQLRPIETAYFVQEISTCSNLSETLLLLEKKAAQSYAVAWVDGLQKGERLGRSLLTSGQALGFEAAPPDLQKQALKVHPPPSLNIPFDQPAFLLNSWSIRLFNTLYFHWKRRSTEQQIVHYNTFFYPLDAIRNWNRLYGEKGLLQYQFVLPFANAEAGLRQIFTAIQAANCTPNLCVLKAMGKESTHAAPISFPMPGFTLAVDFKRSQKTLQLLERLDEMVIQHGGRVYLAKDARLAKAQFKAMYPQVFRHPQLFQSLQSIQLAI
ncbi:MAG: FAD-binding oxidoreductase [Bacteroidota bacterium]